MYNTNKLVALNLKYYLLKYVYSIKRSSGDEISEIKIYELFSGFSEVKMSLKIDVSTSFTGLLQVVKNYQHGGSFF